MEEQNIKETLENLDKGNYSEQEEQKAKYWLFKLNSKHKTTHTDDDLERIGTAIWNGIIQKHPGLTQFNQTAKPTRKLWPRIGIAATIALAISTSIYFYQRSENNSPQGVEYTQDIAPGKQGATLTLSNGKQIRLADAQNGELAREAGMKITKAANGKLIYEINSSDFQSDKINTLSTSNGETYNVKLPDGSMVWLNAASEIKYPASFAKADQRQVELIGEAYFEVAKDKAHPFIVSTKGQKVEVLGTHFNISAYNDEPNIITTLLEGRVAVSKGTETKQLKPGYAAINTQNSSITIKATDTQAAIAWKEDQFVFEEENIQPIMRTVSRWYNVEVIYQGEPTKETYSGSMPRYGNLSQLLKLISSAGKVHFKIEGKKLYVDQ